jgi:hypothetical protein
VAQVEETKASVRLECNSKGASAINIKDIAIQRKTLQGIVSRQGRAETNHSGDTKLARAKIEGNQALVDFKSWSEQFGTFSFDAFVLLQLQVSNLGFTVVVVSQHISHSLTVFRVQTTILKVQYERRFGGKLKQSRPFLPRLLQDVLVIDTKAADLAIVEVEEFQVAVQVRYKLLLRHFLRKFLVPVPVFVLLLAHH